jgi:hypothetical protein
VARVEHGHCVDDVARVLIVATREGSQLSSVGDLASISMDFLEASQLPSGLCRNRRTAAGQFFGPATTEDCWGRSLWAFGTAAVRSDNPDVAERAARAFDCAAAASSPWRRANAFAALGAAEILTSDATNAAALHIMERAVEVMTYHPTSLWPWPEARLHYANAALPDALMAAGWALGRDDLVAAALGQLRWLVERESVRGALSVTPVGGRGPEDDPYGFDQQPIEVATLADACVRAFELTGDGEWSRALALAVEWFAGRNDLGVVMFDPARGGGFDGLTSTGANLNQGAESTIALLTTLQHSRRLVSVDS